MTSIRVELRYDEETIAPVHAGLCESPALDREVILGGQAVDGTETVTSFVYGDPEAYEALLAGNEAVLEYDLTPAEDGFFVYLRRELGPGGTATMEALARDTVVVVPPIEVRPDRTMRLTLVGAPDDLGTALERVPDGIGTDVLEVSDGVTTDRNALSERQLEALRVARDVGYYEVPRENGVAAVADRLDCVVSTASELLRRAEARAVDRVLDARP